MKAVFHAALLFVAAPAAVAWATEPSVPVTGAAVESLKAFDTAMLEFMQKYGIQAGVLAVSQDGRLVLERGYGWADQARTKATPPDALARIASVTKAVTRAAVLALIREGKVSYDTKAFEWLAIEPPGGKAADERIYKVTVRQLLDHRGGWDRAQGGDPMFQADRVRDDLKLKRPPAPRDVVRWMLGKPLQFEPGEREAYSNFGYCVLGRVIEKASGKTYEGYVTEEVLRPAGAKAARMSRDRPADRDPREVWYPVRDDEFSVEVMDAHGGLALTAADLCRFMHAYWISGEPRCEGQRQNWVLFGSLPGTTAMAMQRPGGVDIAALFNGPDGKSREREACLPQLRETLSKAAAETLERPAK
ncbi:MAG: beta-lactamase family protein [Planctomycetes bacterium]|nr:beta-lactamase family protein [Planctomycetota bacterium]